MKILLSAWWLMHLLSAAAASPMGHYGAETIAAPTTTTMTRSTQALLFVTHPAAAKRRWSSSTSRSISMRITAAAERRSALDDDPSITRIPAHLIPTLDLAPLMTRVASYARTNRGKEAIMELVSAAPSSSAEAAMLGKAGTRDGLIKPSLFRTNDRRQRRQDWFDANRQSWKRDRLSTTTTTTTFASISVARSAEEAASEYELVRQAMEVLASQKKKSSTDQYSTIIIPSLPPMFQLHDGVSSATTTTTGVDNNNSDDDEWIDLCLSNNLPAGMDLYREIDLETILKAEQVTKLQLETYEWALSDGTKEVAPGLADIVRKMECIDDENDEACDTAGNDGIQPISELYNALEGAVEIIRAGPSLSDPNNRFSYQFQLASGNGRHPELDALRGKEERLLERKGDHGRKLAIVREEMTVLENRITRILIASMIRAAPDVRRGMNALARLDAVFARASFGCDWDGVIPEIGTEGKFHVEKFVHPVLALEKRPSDNGNEGNAMSVVPVDLMLPGKGGYQALMISGPNGGGKTLALKSFGLVAMMVKLGLPITIAKTSPGDNGPCVVDYFDEVLVEVGDAQSISKQESTLMARLNALSSLIQQMSDSQSSDDAKLVLLDELGGGTDPVAGSALAQSILEKLIGISPMCKIAATTHSPQLKALSINDDRFECASVLMSNEKSPIFELRYGSTGESFALEAAGRCHPSLPDDVIDRAAELMDGGDGDAADNLRNYLLSLEQERQTVRDLAEETHLTWKEVNDHKEDMMTKFEASRMHLSRLESRLESLFEILKDEETRDTFELVGDSLEDLRLLKRKVQTQEELLSQKGLRRVSESHSFYEGETVVIIVDGEWKGHDAVVQNADDPLTVTVVPVLDMFYEGGDQEPLVLKRSDIAVFDYPDWGFSDDAYAGADSYSTRKQSSSNVLSVLSKLDTGNAKTRITKTKSASDAFTSSRQRKAANAAAAKNQKGKKGKKKK